MTIDCDYQDNPVCPHCGYVEPDGWDIDFSNGSDEAQIECARCSDPIEVERHVRITYSKRKVAP